MVALTPFLNFLKLLSGCINKSRNVKSCHLQNFSNINQHLRHLLIFKKYSKKESLMRTDVRACPIYRVASLVKG